jgi:hypothetical protein
VITTAADIDRGFGKLEREAAEAWSNLVMVDRVRTLRAQFREFAGIAPEKVEFEPVQVDENTRWG